jgi:hypothetical protein
MSDDVRTAGEDRTEADTGSKSAGVDRRALLAGAAALGVGGLASAAFGQAGARPTAPGEPNELAVLWTSADPDVAHRVGLMYCHAAKRFGWFERVRLIVWGPSQRTLVGDKDLKAKVKQMQEDGVVLEACIACANTFGIAENLQAIGFEVKPMGEPLSQMLKSQSVAVLSV